MVLLEYTSHSPESDNKLYKTLTELKAGSYIIEIKRNRPIRSLTANKYYWAILTIIATDTGEWDREQLHEVCKRKFNGKPVSLPKGGIEMVGNSTSNLDSQEFAAYVSRVKQWAQNEWGTVIPEARDITYQLWMEIQNKYETTFQG